MNISDHPLFVWPFMAGVLFLAVYLPLMYIKWLKNTSYNHIKIILINLFSPATLKAIKEVFSECLLHLRVFRFNKTLGYMHMSLALGWFLLIVIGKFETMVLTHGMNQFYVPIFFRYFYSEGIPHTFKGIFYLTVMDFLLVFILSGLLLAVIKRFRSRIMGMKRTTKHILPDRIAITFLWLIFPCRWFAESITGGISGTGGFFTLTSGKALAAFLPEHYLFEPAWWMYSIALGGFFIALPFSRYMHIFTEVGLIFLKHWGLKTGDRENGYADFEINACSRCGICTNVCQLSDAGIHHSQAVYFLRDLRYDFPDRSITENCFLCGRCSHECPVDIGIDYLRLRERKQDVNHFATYTSWSTPAVIRTKPAEVLYFAGCMSHLTPGIIQSTFEILNNAHISYAMLDEEGGICCGRPAIQAGFDTQARAIIENTTRMIHQSGAERLLVNCPICYKVFNEEYQLNIPVEHHSVFFKNLIREQPELFNKTALRMSYHDPCDLGRGSGIYKQPREVINHIGKLIPSVHEKSDSLCCGGSLANLAITPEQREMVTDAAYQNLAAGSPDYVVTSCPLCKKTFSKGKRQIPVIDIAEALKFSLTPPLSQSHPLSVDQSAICNLQSAI
jgi:Fe-S oxidoreductase